MVTFAERLRNFRIEAKLSQKELAKKVGISFAAYNKYETKGSEPKIDVLIKLALALNRSVDELVGYIPPQLEIPHTIEGIFKISGIEVTNNNNNKVTLHYDGTGKNKYIILPEKFVIQAIKHAIKANTKAEKVVYLEGQNIKKNLLDNYIYTFYKVLDDIITSALLQGGEESLDIKTIAPFVDCLRNEQVKRYKGAIQIEFILNEK